MALSLLDESPDRIGLLEEVWNHHDTLTAETKLLHNTEIQTQPWKTGLPADYHQHAPQGAPVRALKQLVRRLFSKNMERIVLYRAHPDPRQEQLFFTLLKECLDEGTITTRFLRTAIRRRHLRKDAFALLDRSTSASTRIAELVRSAPPH